MPECVNKLGGGGVVHNNDENMTEKKLSVAINDVFSIKWNIFLSIFNINKKTTKRSSRVVVENEYSS